MSWLSQGYYAQLEQEKVNARLSTVLTGTSEYNIISKQFPLSKTEPVKKKRKAMDAGARRYQRKKHGLPQQRQQRTCYNCGNKGHLKKKCPTISCFNCGQLGHVKRYCPNIKMM
jgi:hypothetical protein